MDIELKKHLENKSNWVRRAVLKMAVDAHSGHVSTAFSQTEMLVALYQGKILNVDPANPKWDGRDRFILSKGQGGIGFYPVLADMGFFPLDELDRFAKTGGIFGVHCEHHTPGIETLSGSLGHGLPVATGMAHAARLDGKNHLIVCMLGDGELYEGSNWEAMFTAGHQQYGRLIVIVDRNGQATIGKLESRDFVSDGPTQEPLADKFKAFGFRVLECEGHDFESIFWAFGGIRERPEWSRPTCIISNTQKGHGASVMQDKRLWHYVVPSGDDLETTIKELNG